MFMKNLKNKFFSVLLISIMILSSMNVIAAVSDDSAIEEETEDALMEVDNSDDNDLKKDAEKTDKIKSDDPKDDVSDDEPSAEEENKLTVTNYSGTYDGKEHSITVKASKSGTTFKYSLDNKTWAEKAPKFKDANGTQTVYIKAENGDDTIYDNGTVTINPVKITLTADSASKTYDGSASHQAKGLKKLLYQEVRQRSAVLKTRLQSIPSNPIPRLKTMISL